MIAVITPLHEPHQQYWQEAYQSLKEQVDQNWLWYVSSPFREGVPSWLKRDKRVRWIQNKSTSIGALKRVLCQEAAKDIVVELDDDDVLDPLALHEVRKALESKDKVFAYSNSASFNTTTYQSTEYPNKYGWHKRLTQFRGHTLTEMVAFPPSAHMIRRVFWAPNHIRAWKADAYWTVGGHDGSLAVGDDHDLCCRFYLRYGASGFNHIDKCLYYYREHPKNTVKLLNDAIQRQCNANYVRYIEELAQRWSRDNGLQMYDLGGGVSPRAGYISVDRGEKADLCHVDLNFYWPFGDSSVGVFRASHLLEHLKDPIHTMNEAYRCLAPGGWFLIEVPSTDGRGAFQDPTHVSFWNSNSFWYYTDPMYARFIPEYKGKFQISHLEDVQLPNNIIVTYAHLIALKPPYDERFVGENKWLPSTT